MPQLDKFIFFSQYFWFFLLFFGLYLLLAGSVLPALFRSLKGRRLLRRALGTFNGRLGLLGESFTLHHAATLSQLRSLPLRQENGVALTLDTLRHRREPLLPLLAETAPLWFPPSTPSTSPSYPPLPPLLLPLVALRPPSAAALSLLASLSPLPPSHPLSPPTAAPFPLLLLWALRRYGRLVGLLRSAPLSPIFPPLYPLA